MRVTETPLPPLPVRWRLKSMGDPKEFHPGSINRSGSVTPTNRGLVFKDTQG
jgi:hypothetical protein